MKRHAKVGDWVQQAVELVRDARAQAISHTNSLMVYAYFHLGKLIVEEEQKGSQKAAYGKEVLIQLSSALIADFGNGFSVSNLEAMRSFYVLYQDRLTSIEKSQTVSGISDAGISQTVSGKLEQSIPASFRKSFPLSWSHYVTLIRIKDPAERAFYEIEAQQGYWSIRELRRQIDSGLFERLSLSKDKNKVLELAQKGQIIDQAADLIKSPLVLEFLGLEEKAAYTESDLETAIIHKIEQFLLEMGKGFFFGGRQVRFSIDNEDFYVDLVLYNRLLQCFVLVDLKIGKLKHQDIGQMQMYVNYYDRYIKQNFEKPTVGIIICKDKSEAVVEITLPLDNKTIFAQEYKLYLPTKAELQRIVNNEA